MGRAPFCDIVIDDPYLSRRDFSIHVKEGEIVVMDEHSRNGLTVNGKIVNKAGLKEGDVIEAGDSKFTVLFADGTEETLVKAASGSPGSSGETVVLKSPSNATDCKGAPLKVVEVTAFVRCWKLVAGTAVFLLGVAIVNVNGSPGLRSGRAGPEGLRAGKTPVPADRELKKGPVQEEPVHVHSKKPMVLPKAFLPRKRKEGGSPGRPASSKAGAGPAKALNGKKGTGSDTPVVFRSRRESDFARFNFQNLMRRGAMFVAEGRLREAEGVFQKACDIARKFLNDVDVKKCRQNYRSVVLVRAKAMLSSGDYAGAYSLTYRHAGEAFESLRKKAVEGIDKLLRAAYADADVDAEGATSRIRRILEAVPRGSPVSRRIQRILQRLQ